MRVFSRLHSGGQTSVPEEVLRALKLSPDDRIEYEIADGRVIAKRHCASETNEGR